MNYEIDFSGTAPVLLIVTLRGSGIVTFDTTLELRGSVDMSDRRSATGTGIASAVFELDSFARPTVGNLVIKVRAGEVPCMARIEVREADRQPWTRNVEIRDLNAPVPSICRPSTE